MSSQHTDGREVEATRLHDEAQRLYDQGDYAQARALFGQALALRRAALGDDAPATAETLGALALVIAQQGDPATARPMMEATLAVRQRLFGMDHPDTAEALNNLAFIRRMQGDDDAARRLYEQALTIRERVLGPDDPATANTLSNLGVVAAAQRDYEVARRAHERALNIFERTLGPDDLKTGRALNNLAAVLAEQGDSGAARHLLVRSLAIHERSLGPAHPSVANVLTNLADLCVTQRDYASARPLYERALSIRERSLGAAHPQTAVAVRNLLSALTMTREMALAVPLNRIAQALARAPGHPDAATVDALHDFVTRLDAALNREPLSASTERALAEASGLQRQADTQLAARDFAGAQSTLERALALREGVFGPDDFDNVALLRSLGVALQAQGEYDRLRPLQERIVEIHVRALGPEHPMTLLARANLMSMRSQDEGVETVLPEMEQMRAALLRQVGPEHPLAQVVQNTSSLMERLTAMREAQVAAQPRAQESPALPDDALAHVFAGLDDAPWRSLNHAYGPATDVPALLRALASPDSAARRRAYHHLYGNIWHQGSVYEATAYAVPFLIRLLSYPGAPDRIEIVRLLTALAEDNGQREQGEDRDAAAAHRAAAVGLPLYLDLSRMAPDQEMRAAALALVSIFPERATESIPWLRAAFEAEQDSLARVWLLLALGRLMESTHEASAFFADALARTDDPRVAFLAAAALAERAGENTPRPAVEALALFLVDAGGGDGPADVVADLEEAMEIFHAFESPGVVDIAIQRLAKLGQARGQPALLDALQRTRDAEVAREIAEALLDLAFSDDDRLQPKSTAISRGPDGRMSVNYWEPGRQARRTPAMLTGAQRVTLEGLAAHDPFWAQDHDLLALYGLPAGRDELRAFLREDSAPLQ